MTISELAARPSRQERRTETARLFAEIADTTDAEAHQDLVNQVIVVNLRVAQALARRYSGRGIPDDDLEQVAYLALTRAAQKFDPGQGRDFLTYAVPTISGELKRHFRDHGWTIRPPRRVQEIQSRVIHAYKVGQETEAPPSPARLATQLDLDEADVREALTVEGCFTPASLDRPTRGDGSPRTVGELLADDDETVTQALEARLMLGPVLATLSARDRQILYLRFVEERTQAEIGEVSA